MENYFSVVVISTKKLVDEIKFDNISKSVAKSIARHYNKKRTHWLDPLYIACDHMSNEYIIAE